MENFESLTDEDVLDRAALLIDQSADAQDDILNAQALDLLGLLERRPTLAGEHRILLHYFRANALENCRIQSGQAQSWSWDIEHLRGVLLELRAAAGNEAFPDLDPIRQCQILTNLGNNLNSIGRPVEAIAAWDRAISVVPNFAMAFGNRGSGLKHYAQSLYDEGHAGLLLAQACASFKAASSSDALFDSPDNSAYKDHFAALSQEIEELIDVDLGSQHLAEEFKLGRSIAERTYRSWCLQHRLFLNPLNDLGAYSIAAHDILHLPSLTFGLDEAGPEPPVLFGFYNQLKQEYLSTRWLCYQGYTEERAHFSDNDTHLYDTLSIPAYGLAVEKTKIAFRLSYSLFDKIAFFINDYFKVGLPEKSVNFRSIWLERKGNPKPLNQLFVDKPNWPLRGLYWLSKDFYEPDFQHVSEPDAEGLADLRNHLEHKYCQVHEDLGIGYSRFATSQNGTALGFRIGRDTLEAKTLHILKLARASLIYLSLAVHREEMIKNEERGDKLVMPMPLTTWDERRRL